MFMGIHFTQTEVERELSDAVPHGMRDGIARVTGIYPAIVCAWFNPNDERKSPQFTVLQMQAALDELCPADGDAHWNKLCAMREASRPHQSSRGLSIDHELGSLSKEITDVIVAKCEGRPAVDQLREIHEAEAQLMRYKSAVLERGETIN